MSLGAADLRRLAGSRAGSLGRIWRLEHAFERARASGRAEDDTRIRIFFVLALFAAGFLTLAIGRDARGAVLRRRDGDGSRRRRRAPAPTWSTATASCWPPTCCTTASTSIRARSGTPAETRRALTAALPELTPRAAGAGAARRAAAPS